MKKDYQKHHDVRTYLKSCHDALKRAGFIMICVKLKATAIPKTANGNENGKYSVSIFLYLRAWKPILVKFSVSSYQSSFLKSICSLNSESLTPKIIYRADASKGTNHDKKDSSSV